MLTSTTAFALPSLPAHGANPALLMHLQNLWELFAVFWTMEMLYGRQENWAK